MRNKAILGVILAAAIVLTLYFGFSPQKSERAETLYQEIARVNESSLKDLKGSYFLLHFWAKWCGPCIDEIPVLVQFSREINNKGNQKPLKILAVSLDSNLEEAKQILPNQGADLPSNFILALDADHKFAEKMGSYQYPETYFVSPQGDIIEKWVGLQKWLQPQVFEFFKQKLL